MWPKCAVSFHTAVKQLQLICANKAFSCTISKLCWYDFVKMCTLGHFFCVSLRAAIYHSWLPEFGMSMSFKGWDQQHLCFIHLEWTKYITFYSGGELAFQNISCHTEINGSNFTTYTLCRYGMQMNGSDLTLNGAIYLPVDWLNSSCQCHSRVEICHL